MNQPPNIEPIEGTIGILGCAMVLALIHSRGHLIDDDEVVRCFDKARFAVSRIAFNEPPGEQVPDAAGGAPIYRGR